MFEQHLRQQRGQLILAVTQQLAIRSSLWVAAGDHHPARHPVSERLFAAASTLRALRALSPDVLAGEQELDDLRALAATPPEQFLAR